MTDQPTDQATSSSLLTRVVNGFKRTWDEPTGLGKAKIAAIAVLLFLFFALFNRQPAVEPIVVSHPDVQSTVPVTATETDTPADAGTTLDGLQQAGADLLADAQQASESVADSVVEQAKRATDAVKQTTDKVMDAATTEAADMAASVQQRAAVAVDDAAQATAEVVDSVTHEVSELAASAKAVTSEAVSALTSEEASTNPPHEDAAKQELAELATAEEPAPTATPAFVTEPVLPSAGDQTSVTTEVAPMPNKMAGHHEAPAVPAATAQTSEEAVLALAALQAKHAATEKALAASRQQIVILQQQLAEAKAALPDAKVEQALRAQVDNLKQRLKALLDGLKSEIEKHSDPQEKPSITKL